MQREKSSNFAFHRQHRQYNSLKLLQVCLSFQPYMGPQCIISRVLSSLEMSSGWKRVDYGSRSRGRRAKAAPSCTSLSPAAAVFVSKTREKLFALHSRGKLNHCHALYNPPHWGRPLIEQRCRSGVNTSTSLTLFAEVLKQAQGSHVSEFNLWKTQLCINLFKLTCTRKRKSQSL